MCPWELKCSYFMSHDLFWERSQEEKQSHWLVFSLQPSLKTSCSSLPLSTMQLFCQTIRADVFGTILRFIDHFMRLLLMTITAQVYMLRNCPPNKKNNFYLHTSNQPLPPKWLNNQKRRLAKKRGVVIQARWIAGAVAVGLWRTLCGGRDDSNSGRWLRPTGRDREGAQ